MLEHDGTQGPSVIPQTEPVDSPLFWQSKEDVIRDTPAETTY